MATHGRYVPNPAFESLLAKSTDVGVQMRKRAELVKQAAETIAEAEANDGGYYKADLDASRMAIDGGRITAFIDARNWKSHWIEWGSINNTARHILQRAAEMVLGPMRGG